MLGALAGKSPIFTLATVVALLPVGKNWGEWPREIVYARKLLTPRAGATIIMPDIARGTGTTGKSWPGVSE